MKVLVTKVKGNLKDFVYSNIITGLFAFGGGVSFLPFFQEYYLDKYQFLSSSRFYELFGYASSMPGPISPLFAATVGYEVFGVAGFFLGIISLVLPSMILTLIFYHYYGKFKDNIILEDISKYMIPVIIGVLLLVIFTVVKETLKYNFDFKFFNYTMLFIIPAIFIGKFKTTPFIPIILNIIYTFIFIKL